MYSILRGFTQRELQVYELVIRGKCNKEVAAALGMTTRTVRFHLSNIFTKAGVAGRIELICRAANLRERSLNSAAIFSTDTGHHASYDGA